MMVPRFIRRIFFRDKVEIFYVDDDDVSPVQGFLFDNEPAVLSISISESAVYDQSGQFPRPERVRTILVWYR